MRFGIEVGGELDLTLDQAVLLYRNELGSRYMATVHNILQSRADRPPMLGGGQLLTKGVLRELARGLGAACPVEVLPEQVVAHTLEVLAWWTAAATRPMFFRADSELGKLSRRSVSSSSFAFRCTERCVVFACTRVGQET